MKTNSPPSKFYFLLIRLACFHITISGGASAETRLYQCSDSAATHVSIQRSWQKRRGAAKVEPNSTFTTALLPESNRRSHGTIYRLHHFKIKTENLEKALWTGYERRYLFWSKLLPYNSLVGTVHKCNVDIHKILVCDITMLI